MDANSAVSMASANGPFATCLRTLRMSAHPAGPEVTSRQQNDANDPSATSAGQLATFDPVEFGASRTTVWPDKMPFRSET